MLSLLSNRPFILQVIGLLFAALIALGIHLPVTMDKESFVAAAWLLIATATIIYRAKHGGLPDVDPKAWWRSRTIWVQIVGAGFAVAALFGFTPPINQGNAVETVMLGLTVLGTFFGAKAKAPVG